MESPYRTQNEFEDQWKRRGDTTVRIRSIKRSQFCHPLLPFGGKQSIATHTSNTSSAATVTATVTDTIATVTASGNIHEHRARSDSNIRWINHDER